MTTIVTRAGKGSPLTNTEMDANLTNLNNDKAELSGATFTGAIAVPAGATGAQAPQAQEVVLKAGSTMTGALSVPSGATGAQVPQAQEVVGITASTGSAKMPTGTTAQRDGSPSAGWTRFNSTLSVNETYDGTGWVQEKQQASAVVATTSGTSHSFTGIPAYATRVELHLDAVSTTGTQNMLVQVGTSAGLVVTGYAESASYDIFAGTFSGAVTAGFPVPMSAATATMRGTVTLFRKPGTNRWECQGLTSRSAGGLCWTTGYIDLPGTLDRIALSRAGADTFDAGAAWATWS